MERYIKMDFEKWDMGDVSSNESRPMTGISAGLALEVMNILILYKQGMQ
jgi:hypothetical protein